MLSTILHVILIIAIVLVVLFVLSLIVYYFNLDMKVAALMEPILRKHYDKMKRNRKF